MNKDYVIYSRYPNLYLRSLFLPITMIFPSDISGFKISFVRVSFTPSKSQKSCCTDRDTAISCIYNRKRCIYEGGSAGFTSLTKSGDCPWQIPSNYTYFKILMLPKTGSGFISPLHALIIPITANTVKMSPTKLRILVIKYNLQEIARMIELKIPYAIL